MANAQHVPVMEDRVVALLEPALERDDRDVTDRTVLLDCTLGLGGHTEAVLRRCPTARVVGIDRDPQALVRSRERLASYGDRFVGVQAVYDEIADVITDQGLTEVDAVLFDLGVSSMQLDLPERGFAYSVDAPLDMRMGDSGLTAAEILNTYEPRELVRILKEYGEERNARRIVDAIVRERAKEPFTNSGRLVELLYDAIPAPARRTGGHPAKRTFQALRMEVNDELRVLERALPAAIEAIGVGGRVVVESYHSLEDRLVKRAFTRVTTSDVPHDMPFVPEDQQPALRLVTRGAEQASAEEIAENPRAASVRLRAVERTRPHQPRHLGVAR